jgi:hypothetical protein
VTGFAVTQGQTYYILASASDSATAGHQTGQYHLNLSFASPTAGHSFATATPLNPAPTGDVFQAGLIATAGLADFYRYVAPQSTALVIREEAPSGSSLDTLLTVYDAEWNPIPGGTSDDFVPQGQLNVSEVRVTVVANQTYYIKAGAFGSSTGPYQLTTIPDGAGNTFATAVPLTVPPEGSLVQTGTILFPGDAGVYEFVAPTSGEMTVEQDAAGSTLDSLLTIFDSAHRLVAFDDDSDKDMTGNLKNSLLQFPMVQGQTYFVEAAAFPNLDGSDATGGYILRFTTNPNPPPDNRHDTFATAEPVDVGSGFARLSGEIDSSYQVNVFRFIAPANESIQVNLDPTTDSNIQFQGDLYAFDDAGKQITTDYNLRLLQNSTSSFIQFNVCAGHTYFVQVAVNRARTGVYDLRFAAAPRIVLQSDGFGHTFDTATVLALDSADDATIGGTIEQTGDVNVFRFQAVQTAKLTVRLFAAPGSRLDPFLFAFTDSQALINDNDDRDLTLTPADSLDHVIDRDSVLQLSVVAGKTYYLKATSAGSSTGG